jgi:hypothetical protein
MRKTGGQDKLPHPWCAAKALLDISWLGISPAKGKTLRFWDRDLSACGRSTEHTAFPVRGRRLKTTASRRGR